MLIAVAQEQKTWNVWHIIGVNSEDTHCVAAVLMSLAVHMHNQVTGWR